MGAGAKRVPERPAMKAAHLTVTSIIDSVEEALRQQILDLDIPPGAAVKETDLATAFAVARPTAKAAIERLVAQGLLRRDVHKSARVPKMSGADVDDLYLTRTMLESQIVRRLAHAHALPPRAAAHIAELEAVPPGSAPAMYVGPDIAFHAALSQHLGSRRVSQIHAGLLQETRLCMAQVQAHQLLGPNVIVAEHQEIIAAIQLGDEHAAAQAMQAHLDRARHALVTYLEQQTSTHSAK